jgi:coronin-1B/1C/6
MNIIDPRASKIAASAQVHEGAKPLKVAWLGSNSDTDQNYKILTTGFTKQAEREIGFWDLRKFGGESSESLNLLCLDQGTGALYPHYDAGTGLAFFPGKGDGNVRYFEMTPNEDPYIHFISQYGSTQAQKSFVFLPKRCCDTTVHEIMKGMKMENNKILAVSFKVPRKSEAFQEDIFPDCPSQDAAMTSESWVKGDECKAPKTMSMKPGEARADSPKKAAAPIVSVASLKKDLAAALARIAELEKENAELKAK